MQFTMHVVNLGSRQLVTGWVELPGLVRYSRMDEDYEKMVFQPSRFLGAMFKPPIKY